MSVPTQLADISNKLALLPDKIAHSLNVVLSQSKANAPADRSGGSGNPTGSSSSPKKKPGPGTLQRKTRESEIDLLSSLGNARVPLAGRIADSMRKTRDVMDAFSAWRKNREEEQEAERRASEAKDIALKRAERGLNKPAPIPSVPGVPPPSTGGVAVRPMPPPLSGSQSAPAPGPTAPVQGAIHPPPMPPPSGTIPAAKPVTQIIVGPTPRPSPIPTPPAPSMPGPTRQIDTPRKDIGSPGSGIVDQDDEGDDTAPKAASPPPIRSNPPPIASPSAPPGSRNSPISSSATLPKGGSASNPSEKILSKMLKVLEEVKTLMDRQSHPHGGAPSQPGGKTTSKDSPKRTALDTSTKDTGRPGAKKPSTGLEDVLKLAKLAF